MFRNVGGVTAYLSNTSPHYAAAGILSHQVAMNPVQKRQHRTSFDFHPPFRIDSIATPKRNEIAPLHHIRELPQYIHDFGTTNCPLFEKIYETEKKPAVLKIPPSFASKVQTMFAAYPGGTKNLSFVEHQSIITTYNGYTHEYSLFNEVRQYRPGYMISLSKAEEAKVSSMFHASGGTDRCDLCSGLERTAEDVFGRIRGKYCFTASNVAKYEQWHGLLISTRHDPLAIDAEVINDYVLTAHRWFETVHQIDPDAVWPHVMWDCGPKASASQVHQHMQISITHDRYYSKAEHTKQAAADYEEEHEGRNYWQDVLSVHERLGLGLRVGRSMIISHLCPVKEREIIIVGESSKDPSFAALVSAALEALKDDVGTRAFSMGMMFRPMGFSLDAARGGVPEATATEPCEKDDAQNSNDDPQVKKVIRTSKLYRRRSIAKERLLFRSYPAIARIVDRGNPLDPRSDVGAMEFFGANNVGVDPYHIMTFLRPRIGKLKHILR